MCQWRSGCDQNPDCQESRPKQIERVIICCQQAPLLECLQRAAHPNSSSVSNRLGKSPMRKAHDIGQEAVEEFLRSLGVQAEWE
jgi:hypothetical protein